jgi:hypothetical protein
MPRPSVAKPTRNVSAVSIRFDGRLCGRGSGLPRDGVFMPTLNRYRGRHASPAAGTGSGDGWVHPVRCRSVTADSTRGEREPSGAGRKPARPPIRRLVYEARLRCLHTAHGRFHEQRAQRKAPRGTTRAQHGDQGPQPGAQQAGGRLMIERAGAAACAHGVVAQRANDAASCGACGFERGMLEADGDSSVHGNRNGNGVAIDGGRCARCSNHAIAKRRSKTGRKSRTCARARRAL